MEENNGKIPAEFQQQQQPQQQQHQQEEEGDEYTYCAGMCEYIAYSHTNTLPKSVFG